MLNLLPKDLERFWAKVSKTSNCWEWTAAKSSKGYGRFKLNGRLESPHVISYQQYYQEDTVGKDVCHTCDNPSCVNPNHLFLGSRSENMKDCVEKNRHVSIPPNLKGQDVTNSKLTNKDVVAIKALLKTSIPQKDIALMFNVAPRTISNINTGATWGHL